MQNAFVLQVLDSDACPLYVCARVNREKTHEHRFIFVSQLALQSVTARELCV